MNKTYFIFFLLSFTLSVKAQQSPIGELTDEDLTMLKYTGDTTASAVVLKEYGNARINNDDVNNIRLEYHVRIKLFNSKGFDAANVSIPLYKGSNNREEIVKDISGFTSYKDESGKVIRVALETKDIFNENKNKYWNHLSCSISVPGNFNGLSLRYPVILSRIPPPSIITMLR